jgi:glycosyltransferase involved in cell wall biosynthesis
MFYFIQGYEDWGPGLKAILEDTYHYPLRKIVIAHWLQEMLKKQYNETSVLITNGFDFHKYRLTIPIREKDPMRITMLYHTMELKDCSLGFRALEIVKQQYPELQVDLIGAPIAPVNLPSWYTYHHHPGAEEHNLVNNQAAIYIGTSRTEGWGLTVGEAMICGQAVCCTDNAGYSEMAEDGVTALMSPVGDAEQMAKNIKRLIADPDLRLRIAQRGHDAIQRFTWNSSYQKFKRLISE